ncbi:MAG: hypothetical protein PVJ38_02570 [Candidatus Bathyarchaeota archaeon]|jgi:hypothetical protein
MNEYTKGALECLSWIEGVIKRLEPQGGDWETLLREIDEAVHDIRQGIGVDFRERLRATA